MSATSQLSLVAGAAHASGVDTPRSRIALRALLFAELWERFSFYGMRSLLVLYALHELGHTQPEASRVYSVYMACAFFGPALGDVLGDRVIGRERAVMAGAVLMLLGHGLMAVDRRAAFYAALALVASGCGAFKPNLTAMLSRLYAADDPRRDRAFLAFYAVTCVGAALAPIVCGFLSDRFGFRFGFAAAAIGMAAAIVILRLAWSELGGGAPRTAPATPAVPAARPSRARDLAELKAAVFVSLFAVVFWIAAEQAGNTLTVFADREVDRVVRVGAWGWTIPTSSLLALNPIAILVLMPLLSRMWRRAALRGRERSTASKMAIGLGVMAAAFVWLILTSAVAAHRADRVGVISIAMFYVIASAAELYVLPSGMSLVTKVARPTRRGTALAPWFLAGFVGNILAGRLAESWEHWSHAAFFGAVAVLCAGGAVCLWAAAARLERTAARAADGGLEDVDTPTSQASRIASMKGDSP